MKAVNNTSSPNVIPSCLMLIILSMVSSCTVYSTGFNCPDSKGARCVMLSQVDSMVDSGEIETVYLSKRCRGVECKKMMNVPKQKLSNAHKVKLEPLEESDVYQDGENLYLKR